MFLKYSTREGHFNLMQPSETSYSCHAAVYDENADRIISTNFDPGFELNGNDVDELAYELQESLNRTWSTDKSRKEMLDYLNKHQKEIENGNRKRRLAEIETELAALNEEKENLQNA